MSGRSPSPANEADFLREVLELSPFGVFQADIDGNWYYLNRQLEDVYGLTLDEARDGGWMSIVYEEDVSNVQSFIHQILHEKKATFTFSFRIHHKKRGLRWCRIYSRFVFNDHHVPLYYWGFVEDITE